MPLRLTQHIDVFGIGEHVYRFALLLGCRLRLLRRLRPVLPAHLEQVAMTLTVDVAPIRLTKSLPADPFEGQAAELLALLVIDQQLQAGHTGLSRWTGTHVLVAGAVASRSRQHADVTRDQPVGLGGHTGVAQEQVRIGTSRFGHGCGIRAQLEDVCMRVAGTRVLGIPPTTGQRGDHSMRCGSAITGI